MVFFFWEKITFDLYSLRELKEDPRFVRRKVEKDRTTEKEWKDFMQNPARFTQVTHANVKMIILKVHED